MIIKYFIYTISLFFILLINGCFRSQDTSHTSKLSEYQVKKYQDLLVQEQNLLAQEQRKRQDLEYELNDLKKNNNNGQNLEINELNSKIKNLENDLNLKDYLNKSQKESKDLEIQTKDMEIKNLKAKIANLKNIASIKDIKYLTDTSKAPDLSQASLDDQAAEEIAETIVNKNINEIKNLLTSSKAPQEVIDAVKRQLQTKGYGYDQINNILNPKITINDKDITAIDKQAKDQLILQLQHASEQEKLAFQNNLVNKIENNILANEETLEVFYKVVDLNNQKDELFNNPKLMPAVKKLMQANPDKQMDFISKAKDSNKIVELLTNADALGIAKEVIVSDKYELTSKIHDDFSLLEYADWNNNPGIIEAYRKKFTDDEWQERLLKKFNYFIDKKLDKVSQELSAHNFDIETINTLREKFKITTQAGDFSDKIKDVIESNAIDIETNIKKSALFLNEQGLKNMAEYIVNNLSIFAEKNKLSLHNMKKTIPFLDKYLDNKDQNKLTDFKNKLGAISIYRISPNFKGLSNDDKTELIRQIDTANDKEKNKFFRAITRDIANLNANLVEVIDKLLASGAIKKEKIQQKFDEIYKKHYFSKQNNIENQLIETFLKYITAVSPDVLEHINGEIKLADNEIKSAHSKEDFIGIYKKHKDPIYKGYIINYLYENKNNNEQKEALKELLQDKENSYLLLQTSKDRKDLLDNAKDIGFDVNKYGRDEFINDQNTIEAYKNKFTNEEYKNKLLDSKYIMISNLNKSVEEVKKNINEIRSRFLITEDMLGDFNDSYKNILNQPYRWFSNEIVNNISKIMLFLKEDKDINDMAEYIVSNKFNQKIIGKFDFDISQKIVYFLEKYLTDKSKLDDLVTKLTKHKDTLAYKDIIDVYKKSNLLTEEQKKKL